MAKHTNHNWFSLTSSSSFFMLLIETAPNGYDGVSHRRQPVSFRMRLVLKHLK